MYHVRKERARRMVGVLEVAQGGFSNKSYKRFLAKEVIMNKLGPPARHAESN